MSYQVLARKYRSQNFDQMIGQNHVSQTLINALKNGRLPHALLFTGIRGTGKTSSARILAKSLRCQNAVDFKPCEKCNDCLEITAGRSMDVIEIDGASNNGVDSIRDLRDNVMFSPSSGKYKVFIIDEVHMLSTSAFNALLKTLEEPPEHVVFIMATTEVQKIPQTILSRCQRFDFKRVSIAQLTSHLEFICQQENCNIDPKGLWLIARQGEGSVRDSLSLLDQVINFSNAPAGSFISSSAVSEILGLTDRALIFECYKNLIERDSAGMLKLIEKITSLSINVTTFLEDLVRLVRHSIILKSLEMNNSRSQLSEIDLPSDEIENLNLLIKNRSLNDLHMLFDMCLKSIQDSARSYDPLLVLEVALLRMAQAPLIQDLKSFLTTSSSPGKPPETPHPKPQEQLTTKAKVVTAQIVETPQITIPNEDSWEKFILNLKSNEPILSAKVENLVFQKYAENEKIIYLDVPAVFSFLSDQINQAETQKKLQGLIDSFFGSGYTFTVQKTKNSAGDSVLNKTIKKEIQAEEKLKQDWAEDPRVKAAQTIFNGTIKIIKSSS